MFFPANVIVALIAALIYIFIAFKIPGKYKTIFRFYSIFIQVLFIIFLLVFPLFMSAARARTYFSIFACSLDIFYFLLYFPLLSLVVYYTSKWFINVEGFPKTVKYFIFLIILIFLIALTLMGYILFVFTHYGFAP